MERRATLISLHAYELEILGTFHLKIQAEEKENWEIQTAEFLFTSILRIIKFQNKHAVPHVDVTN